MASPNTTQPQPVLKTLTVSADLLARLERSSVPMDTAQAFQYRLLVQQIQTLLRDTPPGDRLSEILDAYPATAILYENLHYEHAGLCRTELETSLRAEMAAAAAIFKAMKGAPV